MNIKNNMTDEEFEKLFDSLISKCRDTLIKKNKEYSRSSNRFAAFDKASEEYDIDVLKVWGILSDKGFSAIKRYCKNKELYSGESIENRILDGINYLMLLYGLVKRDENKDK